MNTCILPNGQEVFCNNSREALFLYEEIFLDKVYTSNGIQLNDDSVVVDAGANVGLFSLHILENFSRSRVYAFEPSPHVYKILEANTKKYSERSRLFRVGLSNEECEKTFFFYPNYSTFSTFFPDNKPSDKKRMENVVDSKVAEESLKPQEEKCKLVTLSSIIERENIEKIDLLKMDVQRAELYVLQGIKAEHWKKIKQISFELHHLPEEEVRTIEDLLTKNGFRIEKKKDKLFTPDVPVYMVYAFNS